MPPGHKKGTELPTLRERLCATVPTSGHIRRMGSKSYLVNPDGPAAAAMLQTAAEALEVAANALDDVWADVKLGQRSGPTVSNARRKVRATLERLNQ